jgi:hypothetical protein
MDPGELTILSGGQTGADRAALDAALAAGAACGGWCPEGRRAEDGVIPARYPVKELLGAGYRGRTLANVRDSDGTAIFYFRRPSAGTELTLWHCIDERKPYLLIDSAELSAARAAERLREFIADHAIRRLNVAGPRASGVPTIHAYVYAALRDLLQPGQANPTAS